MADEFDLIEARISVKVNDGDLDSVKDQIDALTKKLNKLKVGVGMRLIGRKEFREQLRNFLAGIKTGNKALISPVLANKSQLTKQIKEATSDAVGKGVSIKVSADVKEAEAALDRVIGKSRTVSSAGKRASGSVDYLDLQIKRWGRLNGRLAEAERLRKQIRQTGFGSAEDMENIRSQMSYYDRLQNQATRIADLSTKLKEWGELPGRMAKSQELLAKVTKAGFGSQADFRRVDREMSRLDRTINNTARKNEARAYINEWGKASGKIQEAADLLKIVDQNDIFKSSDFKAIRELTKDIDKAAAAAAKARGEMAKWVSQATKSGKFLNYDMQPTPGNKYQFKNPFIPIEKFQSDAIDLGQKARAEEQEKAIARAKEELNVRKKLSTQSVLDAAQKKAAYEFTRGRRDDAKVTTEDISWAAPLVRKREQAAAAAKEEADRQAKIRADAEERVKSELQLERMRTKTLASLKGKAVEEDAKNTARSEFLAGKRQSEEITRKDLQNSSKKLSKLQQIQSLEESQNARARQLLDITRATANAEVKRIAQKKADFDLSKGKRTSRELTAQDFRLAEAIYQKKKQITDAEQSQEQAAARLRRTQKENAARETRRDQALRGALFEAGFVAGPVAAIAGNLVGVGNQVRKFTENTTLADKVSKRFGISIGAIGKVAGVAGAALAGLAAPLAFGFSKAFEVVTEFNQRALAGLRSGLASIVAPAAAVLQGIRNLATYLPFVVAGLGGLIAEDLTKATVEFDKLKSLFDLAFGGGAEQQLGLVRSVSDRYGVALDALAEGYAKITVASKKSGITLDETRDLFLGTASAAARLKLTGDDLQGVFRAYQQIISKSNVSSEELRSQLSERLPGAFQLAADALGYSTDQLSEALAKREVSAEQFVPAFGAALRRSFDKQAEQIVDTLPAKLNRLQNSLLDLRRSAEGTGFLEAFVDLKQAGINTLLADGPIKNGLKAGFTEAGKAIKFVTAQIPKITQLLGEVWTAVGPLVTAFAELQLIFSGLALAAVKELVTVGSDIKFGFGDSIKVLVDFSRKMKELMGLDFKNVESVFAFVETAIKRSDLALKMFITTLEIAVRGLVEFAVTLYVKLFDELIRLGASIGFEIGKGIWKGIQAYTPGTDEFKKRLITEEYRDLKQFQKDLSKDPENAVAPKSVLNLNAGYMRSNPRGVEGAIASRLRELQEGSRGLGMSFSDLQGAPLDTGSLVETTLKGLSESTADFLQRFADDPRLEELAKEFGVASKEVQFLREAAAKASAGLNSMTSSALLPSIRTSSQKPADGSGFESQFFGFEEFQRFLQGGTSETVQVAENTKRIVEYSAEQVNSLNRLGVKTDTLIQLMGMNGVYSTPSGGLGWEN